MITTYEAELLEKKEIAPHIYFIKTTFPPTEHWTFKAGQYMIFHIPQGEGHSARRLYSIASHPGQTDSLDFIIEFIQNGVASTYLNSLSVDETITMQGPAGMFVYRQSEREPMFLSTGTGIAPEYSMIKDLLENGYDKNVYLFWGLKKKDDLYYFDSITNLAKTYSNFHFKLCLSREDDLTSLFSEENLGFCTCGRITKGFDDLFTERDRNNFDYYLCGSKHVVEALRGFLTEQGVPKEQVYFEKFTV